MFGETQTYGSLMLDSLQLFTAAGNKEPKRSLLGYDTASGAAFAWCFQVMGLQRGKTIGAGERNGLGEYTPKLHGEGERMN